MNGYEVELSRQITEQYLKDAQTMRRFGDVRSAPELRRRPTRGFLSDLVIALHRTIVRSRA